MSDSQGAPDAYETTDFSQPGASEAQGRDVLNDEGVRNDRTFRRPDHDSPYDPGHSFKDEDTQWIPEARDAIGDIEDDSVYEQTNKGTATAAWVNGKSLAHDRETRAYAKTYAPEQDELVRRANTPARNAPRLGGSLPRQQDR